VLTNAEGTTIYSEDFESCGGSLPAKLSTIDNDGDGNIWEVKENKPEWNPFWPSSKGVSSASYDFATKETIIPDDWLIISDVELGGTLSFKAYAQMAEGNDIFAVYVSSDAGMKEVPISNNTSYHATQLSNNVPYTWRVKGVSASGQSRWVTSMFQTPYDPNAIATDIEKGQRDLVKGQKDEWFTIDGQKLSGKPKAAGVYIKNGNKVVMK
jgi:hypothetical protein